MKLMILMIIVIVVLVGASIWGIVGCTRYIEKHGLKSIVEEIWEGETP